MTLFCNSCQRSGELRCITDLMIFIFSWNSDTRLEFESVEKLRMIEVKVPISVSKNRWIRLQDVFTKKVMEENTEKNQQFLGINQHPPHNFSDDREISGSAIWWKLWPTTFSNPKNSVTSWKMMTQEYLEIEFFLYNYDLKWSRCSKTITVHSSLLYHQWEKIFCLCNRICNEIYRNEIYNVQFTPLKCWRIFWENQTQLSTDFDDLICVHMFAVALIYPSFWFTKSLKNIIFVK